MCSIFKKPVDIVRWKVRTSIPTICPVLSLIKQTTEKSRCIFYRATTLRQSDRNWNEQQNRSHFLCRWTPSVVWLYRIVHYSHRYHCMTRGWLLSKGCSRYRIVHLHIHCPTYYFSRNRTSTAKECLGDGVQNFELIFQFWKTDPTENCYVRYFT